MPLNPVTLTNAILRLTDQTRSDFVGWPAVYVAGALDLPATHQLVAENWAGAARTYFSELIFPVIVIPSTLDLAETAMVAAMTSLVAVPGGAAVALVAGFQAFAAAIVPGVLPAVAIPPPAPPPIAAALAPFAVAGIADPQPPAAAVAAAVDTWARTGLAGVPPQPPTTPWS
jgi:hypothetical protein